MFNQLVERSCVEDIRAGFRAIKDKQANVIVADLTPNHWTRSNCRHRDYLGSFSGNSKRRRNCHGQTNIQRFLDFARNDKGRFPAKCRAESKSLKSYKVKRYNVNLAVFLAL